MHHRAQRSYFEHPNTASHAAAGAATMHHACDYGESDESAGLCNVLCSDAFQQIFESGYFGCCLQVSD